MSKPYKKGLDYFPFDTDMDSDPKVELLGAEFGLKGFAIWTKLLMRIYSQGYFYEWDNDVKLLFAKKYTGNTNNTGLVDEVLHGCFKRGLLNKRVFDVSGVLTSKQIQKRYLKIVNQLGRTSIDLCSGYWLLELEPDEYRISLKVDGKPLKETLKPLEVRPQRKRKERETKEKKQKNKRAREKIFFRESVSLSQDEYDKLCESHDKPFVERCLDKLNNYKLSKGKKYKSDYRAILSWVIQAIQEEQLNQKQSKNGHSNARKDENRTERFIRRGQEVLAEFSEGDTEDNSVQTGSFGTTSPN